MKMPVYLDNNATTPIDPRVTEVMQPYFNEQFGNASSSSHAYGWNAKKAVKIAREQVAQLIGADSDEIIFTSGATESNNLAILGYLFNFLCPTKITEEVPHFITSAIEHKAVFEVGERLKEWGCEVTFLDPDSLGRISAEQVRAAIRPNTKLISIMWANNEIGTINPIEEISQICQEKGIPFHTDAAQAVGKVGLNVKEMGIDLLSLSAHKIYGPKGIGALYIKRKDPEIKITPFTVGGSQERGIRPGTLNVPGIVGLGMACQILQNEGSQEKERIKSMQSHLIKEVLAHCPGAQLNGHPTERLYNNISFSFSRVHPEDFALGLSGLAISSSSACSSNASAPSYVLKSIGLSDELALATIRIGLGRFTQQSDLDLALQKIIKMHSNIKHLEPNT
tara:strand:+ start:290 stop:1471 length:1182 start_codon:yes stop_codon:yes gene_type:complete